MYPSQKTRVITSTSHVEQLLCYKFKNPSLLAEALTHPSDPAPISYQRLEFLGDAALGMAFSKYFYLTCPDLGPGYLTDLRIANVTTEKLARVAVKHGFYNFVRRRSPQLDETVEEFTVQVERENQTDLHGLSFGGSEIKAPKVLADIVESIAAAVYIDCGFNLEKLWTVFRKLLEPIITRENLDRQPITALYIYCQKKGKSVDFTCRKSLNTYVVSVFVGGDLLGTGSSENRTIAKLNAARDALEKLRKLEGDDMEVEYANQKCSNSKHKLNEIRKIEHWPEPVYRNPKLMGGRESKQGECSDQRAETQQQSSVSTARKAVSVVGAVAAGAALLWAFSGSGSGDDDEED